MSKDPQKSLNIAIIGAGPIGCYVGYLLAKNNHMVNIYENHAQVGKPIQCTGILTADFDHFNLPTDTFLVNTINKIDVHSPNASLSVNQKDYIVCRHKFDNFFADLAKEAGARINLSHSFQKKENNTLIIKDSQNNQTLQIQPDLVIAADGPLSPTAKAYGFYHKDRKNYFGVQATVEGNFEPNTIITYFGNEVCPGLFAWVTPESPTIARVGLATTKNSKHFFDKFVEKHNFQIKEMQAGTIPIYHPKQKLHKDNCYLLGDASGYVKATTLGGLVPALKQAQILADCIINNKDYEREVKPIKKQLQLHRYINSIFNKFSDKDWDKLVSYVIQPKIQKIFERYTRDNPIPLVTNSLLKEPRFLFFIKYLL